MGTFGSKENLGQIGVIYGYNSNNFAWRNTEQRKTYCTSGLIINHLNAKYVITTRTAIISCKNIIMYHRYFKTDGSDPIMKNDLQILFQSIEYNLIILVTMGCDQFDPAQSDLISGENIKDNSTCLSHTITNKFIIPTKKSEYYTVKTDIDLNSDIINYDVHIYDVKFVKSIIDDSSYLPDTYMYKYIIKHSNPDLLGICGATIFKKSKQQSKLVGIVSRSEGKDLLVIPAKILSKIINDVFDSISGTNNYGGPLNLLFDYKIYKKTVVKVAADCVLDTNQGHFSLKKNDQILSINSKVINVMGQTAVIFDKDFNEKIPLDIYLKLHLKPLDAMPMEIKRGSLNIKINAIASTSKPIDLSLTNQPFFYPENVIPFVNIGGIIIVQVTHELLDITIRNKIMLSNKMITNIINDDNGDDFSSENQLIIIDCLDETLANEFHLPHIQWDLVPNKKIKLVCPLITHVNSMNICTLDQLNNLDLELGSKVIMSIGTENDSKEIIVICS